MSHHGLCAAQHTVLQCNPTGQGCFSPITIQSDTPVGLHWKQGCKELLRTIGISIVPFRTFDNFIVLPDSPTVVRSCSSMECTYLITDSSRTFSSTVSSIGGNGKSRLACQIHCVTQAGAATPVAVGQRAGTARHPVSQATCDLADPSIFHCEADEFPGWSVCGEEDLAHRRCS